VFGASSYSLAVTAKLPDALSVAALAIVHSFVLVHSPSTALNSVVL
jgi:hypothetical protein